MEDIYESIHNEDYDTVKHILETEKIDINKPDTDDLYCREYPLTIACKTGNARMVKLLLDNGANPNVIDGDDYDRWTPLHIAAANGYTEIARLLLEKGADVYAVDWDRRSPMRFAMRYNYTDIVELIEKYYGKI